MNQGNTGGILAYAIAVILILVGLNEAGELDGYKRDILAFLEILK